MNVRGDSVKHVNSSGTIICNPAVKQMQGCTQAWKAVIILTVYNEEYTQNVKSNTDVIDQYY